MKKLFFHIALMLCLSSTALMAQVVEKKLHNGGSISVKANGVLFSDMEGKPSFTLPEYGQKSLAEFGTFWISALNPQGKLLQSASTNLETPEFWSGPMDTFTRKSKTPADWNYVWLANRSEIELHRKNYQNNGYVVPSIIREWPGNSVDGQGLPAILAPYFDWDKDGIYSPERGDYPAVKGNEAAYLMYNDEYGEHAGSQSIPLKAQIQQLIYDVEGVSDNAFIIEAYVRNMSDEDWKDAYIGFYTDLTLGNNSDNYAATVADKNLIIGYNGDKDDEGISGFGDKLPYFGAGWLNQKSNSTMVFADAFDYRSFKTGAELRNLMTGKLVSGSLKHGKSRFTWPGNTDLSNTGVEISEESALTAPGNRSILNVAGPFDIPSNGFIKLELAVFGGLSSDSKNAAIQHWNAINDFYKENLDIKQTPVHKTIIYPNPVNKGTKVSFVLHDYTGAQYTIYDSNGREIGNSEANESNSQIDTKELKPGIYFIKISRKGITETQRIVVID